MAKGFRVQTQANKNAKQQQQQQQEKPWKNVNVNQEKNWFIGHCIYTNDCYKTKTKKKKKTRNYPLHALPPKNFPSITETSKISVPPVGSVGWIALEAKPKKLLEMWEESFGTLTSKTPT